MAVIRDMMPAFELFQPATIDEAVKLLDRHGSSAWVMAGGLDTFDWLKDRTKRPAVVVDLSQVSELRGIKEANGGLEIGAATPLTEVVKHPAVREKFGILMEAAELVASPQIRNQGTLGGNISQDTRCWYYRSGWSCYRAGGNICYADTPTAINREHAILEQDRCVAVNPSDTAPALIALDAELVIRSVSGRAGGEGGGLLCGAGDRHPAHDGAAAGGTADDDPDSGDVGGGAVLLREGARPERVGLPAGERGVGDQVQREHDSAGADRGGRGGGAAAAAGAVEAAIAGQPRNEATATMAGQLAIEGATALRYNGYKIPLMRNLVKRAIRGTGAAATT